MHAIEWNIILNTIALLYVQNSDYSGSWPDLIISQYTWCQNFLVYLNLNGQPLGIFSDVRAISISYWLTFVLVPFLEVSLSLSLPPPKKNTYSSFETLYKQHLPRYSKVFPPFLSVKLDKKIYYGVNHNMLQLFVYTSHSLTGQ